MADPLVFPIFPLPSVLLVPGAFVPLHIFEPRYRAMVADAMAGDRRIAMAMPLALREGDDPERPRVHPVVGLGRIVHHRPHPDGRCDIVLAGVMRARILREIEPDRAYRTVEAEPLPDVETSDERTAAACRALVERIEDLAPEDRERIAAMPPGSVLDAVLLRLGVPAREKHRIHANPRVDERLAETLRLLARMSGVLYPGDIGPGDPRLN